MNNGGVKEHVMESKLKNKRLCEGYTQTELAEASGVSVKSIAAYEQDVGKINNASVKNAIKLADSLGCCVEDIVERELL